MGVWKVWKVWKVGKFGKLESLESWCLHSYLMFSRSLRTPIAIRGFAFYKMPKGRWHTISN